MICSDCSLRPFLLINQTREFCIFSNTLLNLKLIQQTIVTFFIFISVIISESDVVHNNHKLNSFITVMK